MAAVKQTASTIQLYKYSNYIHNIVSIKPDDLKLALCQVPSPPTPNCITVMVLESTDHLYTKYIYTGFDM